MGTSKSKRGCTTAYRASQQLRKIKMKGKLQKMDTRDDLVMELEKMAKGEVNHPFEPDLTHFDVRRRQSILVTNPGGEDQEVTNEEMEKEKEGLFKKLTKLIGFDITNVTIPISYS